MISNLRNEGVLILFMLIAVCEAYICWGRVDNDNRLLVNVLSANDILQTRGQH